MGKLSRLVEFYVGRVPYRLAPSAPFLEATQERGTLSLRAGQMLIQVSRVPGRDASGETHEEEQDHGSSGGESGGG